METIRSALTDVLVANGIANGLAGRPSVHGIGAGLPRGNKADPLTAQPWEAREPMGMGERAEAEAPASDQPWREAGDPSPARNRPVLRVVNGKCLPRETPMRGPRNSLGRHLALVWSQ